MDCGGGGGGEEGERERVMSDDTICLFVSVPLLLSLYIHVVW